VSLLRGKHTYLLTIKGKESDTYKKTLSRIFEPFVDSYGFQSYYHDFHYHILLKTDALLSDLVAKIPAFRATEFRVALLSPTLAQSANADIQIKAFNSNSAGFLNYVFSSRNFQPFICAASKRQPIFVAKRLQPELERTTSLLKTLNEMYAARKRRLDATETVPSHRLNLKFLHIMKSYFADIQLPSFLFASENSRRRAHGKEIPYAVAHVAVFEDPTSLFFNLEDRYWNQKYAKASRNITYSETYDYFPYPEHCYDRIEPSLCTSDQLRILKMRRRHDTRVFQYINGTRSSVLPPRSVFQTVTPMAFVVMTEST